MLGGIRKRARKWEVRGSWYRSTGPIVDTNSLGKSTERPNSRHSSRKRLTATQGLRDSYGLLYVGYLGYLSL